MKVHQINNLKITYSKTLGVWLVRTPDNRTLEQFRFFSKAKAFAEKTRDFTRHVHS